MIIVTSKQFSKPRLMQYTKYKEKMYKEDLKGSIKMLPQCFDRICKRAKLQGKKLKREW